MTKYQKPQPIVEVYPCLQSEGKLTGIPHILIRTTGCPLRCQFSDTDFCDSAYTSWNPEKGSFTLNDVIAIYKQNPQIKHTMITGGSPTLHEKLLKDLIHIAKSYDHYVTLETEGSKFVEGLKVDLLSLSPKLSNSSPRIGTAAPDGKKVTSTHYKLHETNRKNYDAMLYSMIDSRDYQLKPVISNTQMLQELQELQQKLHIPNEKVWLMPAGGTNDELQKTRGWLMQYAWQNGYNYTDRIHIVAYGNKRGV